MLAQNFKTADELKISEEQRSALQKTLALLETERLQHVPEFDTVALRSKKYTGHFNMRSWASDADCGTIRCIGGTACAISGNPELFVGWDSRHDLTDLFAPARRITGPWHRITPSQAATALRSYLATGEARWDLAVQL